MPASAGSWPFSEGTGSSTADSSGHGHTGTLGSGATWAAPEVGAHSIATNGTATGAVTVSGPVVNTAQSYTASAWVYLNAIGGQNQTFVSINGASPTTGSTISGFFLQFQGAIDKFAFEMYNSDSSSAGSTTVTSTLVAAGTWYHIVGVDDVSAHTLSLYLNGVLQQALPYTSSWQATGNTLIGQGIFNGTAGDFVSGKIDNVALYSSALTAAQVAALNLPVIAAGLTSTCTIIDGNASCWGDNSTGTLGDNSTVNSSVPVPVYTGGVLAGLTLTQISVGGGFACALASTGAAYCWGGNGSGQLGNGTTTSSNIPVLVSGGLTFSQIDVGSAFACALTTAGAAYCWGNDAQDQLGNTTLVTNAKAPVAVTGGLAFAQISTGTNFACALTAAGAAYCWGDDTSGQIGNASATNPQTAPKAVTTVGTPLSGVTLTQISAAMGGSTACALSSAGAAYCWGLGTNGELGNNTITAAQATAVAVTVGGASAIPSGTILTQITGGQDQTCALASTGVAYCWGGNGSGDLGNNSTTQSNLPVAVSTTGVLSGKYLIQLSATGSFVTCAIGSFGAPYCWGLNTLGQLGDPDILANTTGYFPVPVVVSPDQATQIAAGYQHSCVLFHGSADCWGDNTYGELGNNSTVSSTSPVQVAAGAIPGGTVMVQVTAGNGYSCALSAVGAAYCWGKGTSGQLGNGSSVGSKVPVLVSGGLTFTGISAGGSSACGVTSAGAAYCWGLGASGQLGNNGTASSSAPVPVTTTGVLAGLTVAQVSAGGSAACTLATTGAVYCWGQGTSGQLGNGTLTAAQSTPAAVSADAAVGATPYREIGAGGAFACAVSGAGAEYCWGDDTYGELGNGTTTGTPVSTPVAVTTSGVLSGVAVTQIAAGLDHACAVIATGTASCWGLGTNGQLGDNATATSSVPAAVYTGGVLAGRAMDQISAGQYHACGVDNLNTGYCWGLNSSGQDGRADTGASFDTPVTIQPAGPDLIIAGYTHACLIRSGIAYCWGDNTYGQLGNNSTVSSSVPVPVSTSGALAGVTLIQIVAGNGYTCALDSVGAAFCWGYNADGELGNGTTTASDVPVAVTASGVLSGQALTAISAGQYAACGLSAAGAVFCWGQGTSGQLGNGGSSSSSQPVAVTAGGIVFTAVDAGGAFACAVSTTAAAYCWGANASGQLGNGSTTPSSVPVAVNLPGIYVTEVTAGFNHACLISYTTSTLGYCWGDDTYGELGNNATTATPVSTPVLVYTGGTSTAVVQLNAGYQSTCGIDSTGVAYCWGENNDGQVGNNTTATSDVAAVVTATGVLAGKNMVEIDPGQYYTCALDSNGVPYCWGLNAGGQAGNPDTAINSPVPVVVSPYQAILVGAGYTHACLLSHGFARCWGDNSYGELGDNSTVSSDSPVQAGGGAMPGGTVLVQVTAGNGFSCALSAVGTAYCWGLGTSGQLGNGASASSAVPVLVSGGLTFTALSAGEYSACGVTSAGAAYCWGLGASGQLGNNGTASSSSPVAVYTAGVLAGLTVAQVSAGGLAACALTTTAGVFCWGAGASGQLGNGTTTAAQSTPVAVSAPAAGPVAYSQVSAGGAFACALSGPGAEYCWGDDTFGELGNGTTTSTPVSTPVAVATSGVLAGVAVTQIAAGFDHDCAQSAAGAAYCWGLGTSGQLGNNATATSSVPTALYAGGALAGRTAGQVSAGQYSTCALDNRSTVYCWGLNSSGQVGRSDTGTNFDTPVAIQPPGLDVLTAGYTHACLIRSGAAYCWGDDTRGELGNGTTASTPVSTPVAVSTSGVLAGVTLIQIVAGNGYTCALDSVGAAFCWGDDTYGELGNGITSSTPQSTPVAVTTSGVLSGQALTEMSAGQYAACGLSAAGAVYCWGQGTSGQLGNGGMASSPVPVAVSASGIAFTAVNAGGQFACAVANAGTAWCWGANASGQLGNSSTTASPVPVPVNLSGTGVLAVAAGFNHACLVNVTGAIPVEYCWGDDTYGELGNGTTTATPVSTPVALAASSALAGKAVIELNAGYQSTCATDSSGLAYCWGENNDGQAGNNTTATASAAVAVTATGALAGKNIGEIAPGQYYACAMDSNGAAYCWGLNTSGQLGNPDTAINFLVPAVVALSQATTIAAGYTHACLIRRGGQAYCWGDNTYGELGNSSAISSGVPVAVYTGGALSGVTLTSITAGSGYTCALSGAGAVYCWGKNTYGQLGDNSTANSSVPVAVTTTGTPLAGVAVTQISAGAYSVCAIGGGAVYCWGLGSNGQLGINGTASSSVPVAVSTSGVLSGVTMTQVVAGPSSACAIGGGHAYCWGYNGYGQLGNNTTIQSLVPAAVTTSGTPMSGQVLTGITGGTNFMCALSTADAAYCWGGGGAGQLGNGSLSESNVPVAVTTSGALSGVALTQLASGTDATCGLSSAGTAYCWGSNPDGQLGNNTTTQSNVPVAVTTSGVLSGAILGDVTGGLEFNCAVDSAGTAYCWGLNSSGQDGNEATGVNFTVPVVVSPAQPVNIGTGTDVSNTAGHACTLRGGRAYCWGDNAFGELGNNSTTSSPVPVAVYAGGVLSGVTLTQIVVEAIDTCALSSVGKVYCWGHNVYDELGNNTSVSQSQVPVAVYTGGALSGVTAIQLTGGWISACVLSSTSVAYCWGRNAEGELGDGNTTDSNVPVAVTATGVLSGQVVAAVSAGYFHTCATSTAGAAYCWGDDNGGELGDNTFTSTVRTAPVAVYAGGALSGVYVASITEGTYGTCALGSNGLAYCWGNNAAGDLGDGNTTYSTVPVAVTTSGVLAGLSLAQISMGDYTTCALSTAGVAYCWGDNSKDALGINNTSVSSSSVPVAVYTGGVLSGTILLQISIGWASACVLGSTGAVYCWGTGASGQLGNNATTNSDQAVQVQSPVPGSPASVTAFPAGTAAAVYWAAPASLGFGTLTGYLATASPGGASCSTTSALTCTIAGLANGTTYSVTVVTETTIGNSASSTAGTVTPWAPGQISAGWTHACQLSGGKAYCWGDNTYGELGNNTTSGTPQTSPVPVYTGGVLSGVTLTQIGSGDDFTCALSSAGNVYCWGLNSTFDQLGDNLTVNSDVPVAVYTAGTPMSGVTISQLAVGQVSACALSAAGAAYCWGGGGNGNLGNNSTGNSSVPVAVLAGAVPGGVTFTQIAGAGAGTCALGSDAAAYCWGSDSNGQLGDGVTGTSALTPVAVTTSGVLSGVALAQLTVGYDHPCALSSTGTAYCWGYNNAGDLGNGAGADSNVPVAVTASGALSGITLTQITGGYNHTCALSAAGAGYCWGDDTYGELGDGNSGTTSSTAVAVNTAGRLSGITLTQASGGLNFTCALDTAPYAYCWGRDDGGQLGNGAAAQSLVAGYVAPEAPTAVAAIPGNTTLTVSWTAPAYLDNGTAVSYTASASPGTATCTTGTNSCVLTGLTDAVNYTITVTTTASTGTSGPSTAVTAQPVGLEMAVPSSLTWAAAQNGTHESVVDSVSADQQITVYDSTGSGAGWHITLSATTLTAGTHTLPGTSAIDVTGSTTTPLATTAPSTACIGGCVLPSNTASYPVAITTAASSPPSYTIYDTAVSSGEGAITLGGSAASNPIGWWLNIPGSAYTGTYTTTVAITLNSGP